MAKRHVELTRELVKLDTVDTPGRGVVRDPLDILRAEILSYWIKKLIFLQGKPFR